METSIPKTRALIEQTRENLERIVRSCDHCVPSARNEFVSTLDQQNYANLKIISHSLKILGRGERYLETTGQLKIEADKLKEDYDFVRAQYFLN